VSSERLNCTTLQKAFRKRVPYVDIAGNKRVQPQHFNTSANTRCHSAKIVKNRCRLVFFFRKSDRWNGLHQWIIDSTTVNSFKNGLENMQNTRISYFKEALVHFRTLVTLRRVRVRVRVELELMLGLVRVRIRVLVRLELDLGLGLC